MKKIEHFRETPAHGDIAPPLTGGALLNLDGQCFRGPAGVLGVALAERSIRGVLQQDRPTHWLLPLESAWIAQQLPQLEGEILWVSTRPPEALLGALNENVEGAWMEGNQVVLRLRDTEQRLQIQALPGDSFVLSYIARLAVTAWIGSTAEEGFGCESTIHPVASTPFQFAA